MDNANRKGSENDRNLPIAEVKKEDMKLAAKQLKTKLPAKKIVSTIMKAAPTVAKDERLHQRATCSQVTLSNNEMDIDAIPWTLANDTTPVDLADDKSSEDKTEIDSQTMDTTRHRPRKASGKAI